MTKYLHKTAHEVREAGMLSAQDRAKSAQHLPKTEVASETPHNLHLVSRAYEHALSLQLAPTGTRGYMSLFGLVLVAQAGFLFYIGSSAPVFALDADVGGWIVPLLMLSAIALVAGFGFLTVAIRAFRIELFGPKDVPLVFNRKTRKVYKFVPQMPERDLGNPVRIFKYWLTAFQPWPPMLLIEYDWDCLEAEYFEVTQPMGRVVKTLHVLQFYVKEQPDSNWVIGSFTLASPLLIGRSMAMDLWEFVRRYMEEDGPVMHQGDTPAPAYPSNLLQSAQAMLPGVWPLAVLAAAWGNYNIWLHGPENTWYNGAAFAGNAMLLAMLFNWISHFFGREIELPPQMLAGAGEPLDLQALSERANAPEPVTPGASARTAA
jgi:hypothetical protein